MKKNYNIVLAKLLRATGARRALRVMWLVAAVLVLASCTKDAASQMPDPSEQSQSTSFTASFGAVTYATVAASEDEKQLQSVAMFIETTSGDLLSFFSDEPQGSPTAFESATKDPKGNYTATSIKLPVGFTYGNATVTIIGNYAQNGLAEALKAVTAPDDLNAIIHIAPALGLAYPLLTLEQKEVDIKQSNNAVHDEKFSLKRLAARIDVRIKLEIMDQDNNPIAPQDAITEGYFSFAEAYILNPKAKSYLLPTSNANIDAIAQMQKLPAAFREGMIYTFYAYEMSGADASNLEVVVVYNMRTSLSDPMVQKIYHLSLANAQGKSIFERNKYYYVNNITIPYVISDWDDGGTLIGG